MRQLADQIQSWSEELGFQQMGIADIELGEHSAHLKRWLKQGYQGEMEFMQRHAALRENPETLLEGTCRVVSFRMDYLSPAACNFDVADDLSKGNVSRYAVGRDYHKIIRPRLAKIAHKITAAHPSAICRPFTDSAPVLERAFAEKSGLGWIGKNTMLLNRNAGSFFFLGEIYTNLALPLSEIIATNHCGSCTSCLQSCPTQAFTGPYQLDARRCISYLTIELKGSIPEEFRKAMGNRIFGCDECQTACPWNRFAQHSSESDFQPRHGLESADLIQLFGWTESEFLERTAGSAIRRTGYQGWLRNLAVALGNAEPTKLVISALEARKKTATGVVLEHINWALNQQRSHKVSA